MQPKRAELIPVGKIIADLPGPVQALIPSPPAQRHFTRADQVNQLVSASEADASLGFMARTMALCSLPRSNPGNRKEYKCVNGPFTLYMVAGGGNKLPFGNLPRFRKEQCRPERRSARSINVCERMNEPWRLPAEVMSRVQREKTWYSGQRGCILSPCQGQNGNPG